MNTDIIQNIHTFIIAELDQHINTLGLEKVCRAMTGKGKKCTKTVKSDDPSVFLCKKHTNAKNVKVFPVRKNFQCVVYHTHPPNETSSTCPRCISKRNYTQEPLQIA